MEIRTTMRRFPGAAFVLIVGLVAALAVVMTLSIGGWGLAIPGPSSANPQAAAQSQTRVQQPPDAQDRNQQDGQQPVATPQACAGSASECAS